MKYLMPLLLITLSGFAAEPPAVKSKAAQELLKHPEFKKAMEAAPEFTKAVLAELDKHAPKPVRHLDNFWGLKKNTPKPIVLSNQRIWELEATRRLQAAASNGVCPTKQELIDVLGRPYKSTISCWYWEVNFTDEVGVDRYDEIEIYNPGLNTERSKWYLNLN